MDKKKIDEFRFGQSVRKLPGNYGKVLFYKTYFEESNINWKPLIWSKHEIITKYGPKKWVSFILGKVYENYAEIKEKCYFRKHTSNGVILTENHLFCTIIR